MPELPSTAVPAELIEQLRELLADRLSVDEQVRRDHGRDISRHRTAPPDVVVFPENNGEVQQIVRACATYSVPIIPFGTGSAVEGGVLAIRGGVSIDLGRMNRVLRFSRDDADITVEAGVTRLELNKYLAEQESGLYFPVDPGADASLGGMAATRASGSTAVRYGTMRENVMGLTAILADGRLIQTGGRARKSSAGYDLTHLLVGSEGTLAVITGVTLRLQPEPAAISAAVCQFDQIEPAVRCVIDVLTHGVPMARIELLDEIQVAAVNSYSGLELVEKPTLLMEFHGSENHVVEQAETVGRFVQQHGGSDFQWATDPEQRDKLWQARHDAYYASLDLREGSIAYITDVCVPISRLAECILATKQILQQTSLPVPLFGHVGDGNFHVLILIDPESDEELAEAQEINRQVVQLALQMDGTSTGEHGIGIGKQDALLEEHGQGVEVMRAIKQALDPQNIMNPGKVVPGIG
ncbi:MAG: FAD-linked oxidase C-terminal domain-containing protein [Pirellulaceae bacterium]|nr:FAD-linked oxidase C-terminal domain-containing protein [Pirellulaceae bacterium]